MTEEERWRFEQTQPRTTTSSFHDTGRSYQITQKGQPFEGHDISLNSLSDLIVKLAITPGMESRRSLGVSRTK